MFSLGENEIIFEFGFFVSSLINFDFFALLLIFFKYFFGFQAFDELI
jgi:hypothetical protein